MHITRIAPRGGAGEQVHEVHDRHRSTEVLQRHGVAFVAGFRERGTRGGRKAQDRFSLSEATPADGRAQADC